MAWPHPGTDWVDILDSVEEVYITIACAICQQQALLLLCQNDEHQLAITLKLKVAGANIQHISFQSIPYDDTWIRDYAALSIIQDGQTRLLDFNFNGWGHKFPFNNDNRVNQLLNERKLWADISLESVDYVLEGGSLDTDGQGTILTTSTCLLNDNRNPLASKNSVEALLAELLGCHRVLWLDHGFMAGDDTDSHIDMLARFCSPNSIIYMACQQSDDEHFSALKQMEQELEAFRTCDGQAFQLYPVNIPSPIYDQDSRRLPASYVNFLILDHSVLAPVYGDKQADSAAIKQLTRAFPQHKIIAIDCKALIMQHGSLHCATMQWNKGVI